MDEVYGKIFVAANYTNKRSNSFKVKRMRIPNLSYLNNRSTIDNKVSFQDDRAWLFVFLYKTSLYWE